MVRHIDLTTVNNGRVKLVEQKLDVKLLRVPQDFQRPVGSEVHWIVDKQASVHDVRVCVAVWGRAGEDRRIRIRSIA